MYSKYLLYICFLLPLIGLSQVSLDLNHSVKIGNTTTEEVGNIRWNDANNDFEGWDGSQWLSFTKPAITQNHLNDTTSILPLCADTVISDPGALYNGHGVGIHNFVAASKAGKTIQLYSFDGDSWSLDTLIDLGTFAAGINDAFYMQEDFVVAGLPSANVQGRVAILEKTNDKWEVDTILEQSGSLRFGNAVSYNGEILCIGAPGNEVNGSDNEGACYFYKKTAGVWNLIAQINNPDINQYGSFGRTIGISNNKIFIGGLTYTHLYSLSGLVISPFKVFDIIGYSFAYNATHTAIGNPLFFENGTLEGRVFIMQNNTSTIIDTLDVGIPKHLFGSRVSISNDFLLITGMSLHDQGTGKKGIVYVFQFDENEYVHVNTIEDPVGGLDNQFGHSLQINGPNYIIGSPRADVNGIKDKGKFFIGTIK